MHAFDDNDIKIFGGSKIENEADVLIRIVEIMKKQRANGNMERAKELGIKIARQIYSPENIGYSSANLYSIGLALRFYPIKGLSINVDYGFPLSSTTEKLNYGIVYARVSYGF